MAAAQTNKSLRNILIGAAAGAFLLWKIFQNKNESGGTSDENINVDASQLTYDDQTYKTIADAIENYVYGSGSIVSWTEDDSAIGNALSIMYTIDDVYKLIETYGRRYVGVFIQEGGNLVQTISEYLDDDIKNEVNAVYQQRGINFQWV